MYKKLFFGFVISISIFLIGSGVYLFFNNRSIPITFTTDLYPLYSGVNWGSIESTTSPDFGAVALMQSVPFTNVVDIASKSTPFTQYYHDKLIKVGWTEDISRAAGGPGAETNVYTKGDQFIVISFHSQFNVQKPDMPSQCPCDVQFTIMNGLKNI